MRKSPNLFLLAALCLALLASLLDLSRHAPAQAGHDKFGLVFNGASNAVVSNALFKLGITSWYEFGNPAANPNPQVYNKVLVIRTNVAPLSEDALRSLSAKASPGAYWIIGNEPNVPEQDWIPCATCTTLPEAQDFNIKTYTTRYKHYADTIKRIDSTAKLVAGNVLNFTEEWGASGQRFVSGFLGEYQLRHGGPPPVDVWGIHSYVIDWAALPMVNWDDPRKDIEAFRTYLQGGSEVNKPIWITEFGVIWGYPGVDRVPYNPQQPQCAKPVGDPPACAKPAGEYAQSAISQYLRDFVGWLVANSTSLRIEKWFLYTSFGLPEPYTTQYAGISVVDSLGATANLTASGEVYRSLAVGTSNLHTPTPTQPSGGGGGGGGGGGSTPTPTPIPSPTVTPTPAPPATVTAPMGSTGGEVPVRGGSATDGGVSVVVPPEALSAGVTMSIAVSDAPPAGVSPPSGALLLNKTIEVTLDQPLSLQKTVGIRINLTAAELGPRSLSDIQGGVVVESRVEPRPTRIVDEAAGVLWIDVDHLTKFTLFAATRPGPALASPQEGVNLTSLGAILTWSNPPGATQYQVQVAPFNNDGPGINLIRNAEQSYTISPPNFGGPDPNYVMLPGMTYTWRVRTTTSSSPASDLTEEDWSAWSLRTFRTATKTSATITLLSPGEGSVVTSLTPTLLWANADPETFYYEVQVSKDSAFGPDAFLYWELRHGGATSPPNSYAIPSQFPLESATTYYWRVRPRVQGDSVPVAWPAPASFQVAQ